MLFHTTEKAALLQAFRCYRGVSCLASLLANGPVFFSNSKALILTKTDQLQPFEHLPAPTCTCEHIYAKLRLDFMVTTMVWRSGNSFVPFRIGAANDYTITITQVRFAL